MSKSPAVKRTSAVLASAALAAGLTTAGLAPVAAADPKFVSNADGSIRCALYNGETLCVSDRARKSQPQCNPAGQLIPAVSIQRNWAGTKCWNQGFEQPPMHLQPLQIHTYGSRVVIPDFTGDLYVIDFMKPAVIRAGGVNSVLFSL